MSTDADVTPTDQTVLKDQAIGHGESQPQPPMPGPGVTPPSASSTEKTTVVGPREVHSGAVLEDRWRTDACLASGGYGDVWKGVDLQTGRAIAVKILRTDAGNNDPSAIARMRQEAEILKAIEHPNIVSVYGFGESFYGHFLVMEFLDGRAIDQLLAKEGPTDSERAIPIVRQLLLALEEAHSKQILHRDLKPENIIVARTKDGEEVAKLVDFGIAKAMRLLDTTEEGATLVQTRAGGFMGTPRYAAPEQAVGDPCGPNIDLFALGLVIAEWLTGRMRMDGERHGDVMTKLLSPDEIDISDVPYRWREWLSNMVKKNPQERYQSARDALNEMQQLVIELHQPADFLAEDAASMAFGQNSSGGSFASNDEPLELDYDRVRKSSPTPALQRPFGEPQKQPSEPVEAHPAAAPIREPDLHEEEPSVFGTLLRWMFIVALAIISAGAFAMIIGALFSRFG